MSEIRYKKEMTTLCDTKHLAEIRKMLRNAATEFFSDRLVIGKLTLAVDEAVANVMEHAYDGLPDAGYVHVAVWVENNLFKVKITDEGKKFDATSLNTENIQDAVKNGQKNGYGIYLIRQIMDEIHYNYIKGIKNELCMTKKIDESIDKEYERGEE